MPSLQTGLFIFVLLFMMCAVIYTKTEITKIDNQVQKKQQELNVLKADETRLNTEISNKISFTNIEQKSKELGMQKKDLNAVTYVNVNEGDRVVIKNEKEKTYTANK